MDEYKNVMHNSTLSYYNTTKYTIRLFLYLSVNNSWNKGIMRDMYVSTY